MAGNYPDASAHRMAYDKDGTQVYLRTPDNNISQLSGPQVQGLNNESNSPMFEANGGSASVLAYSLVFIFPELRDINGFYLCANRDSTNSGTGNYDNPLYIETSIDTTNGLDGTWDSLAGPYGSRSRSADVKPAYRTQVITSTATNVRAIRIRTPGSSITSFGFRAVHLYGAIATGQNPNRLAIWHPTLNQRVGPSHFDWGDTPRASSADKTFRVKNLSSTLTAADVAVSVNALTDTSPSVPSQHYLSLDGVVFQAQVEAGDIGPNGTSEIITLRRVTPANAALSLWSLRLFAEADSWGL